MFVDIRKPKEGGRQIGLWCPGRVQDKIKSPESECSLTTLWIELAATSHWAPWWNKYLDSDIRHLIPVLGFMKGAKPVA